MGETAGISRPRGLLASRRSIVALFVLLTAGALLLLAYLSVSLARNAVDKRVKQSLSSSSTLGAVYIREELRGLTEVDVSFAGRPVLLRALADGDPRRYDRRVIHRTLIELSRTRTGIGTAFLADPSGRLVDIVPKTPSIIGKDFSFRDWYKGVTRSGRPYVSHAYRSQATGNPIVVAVAAPVYSRTGDQLAILVVAYRVEAISEFAQRFARAQGVTLSVSDQSGVVVAGPGVEERALVSRRKDPAVAAALAGRSGITEVGKSDDARLAAYAPVPGLRWAVVTRIPKSKAFGDVRRLGWTVLGIATLLALVLAAGIAHLNRTLRQRQRAEEETVIAFERAQELAGVNRAVVDASIDALVLVDLHGEILVANSVADEVGKELGLADLRNLYDVLDGLADKTTDPSGFRASVEAIVADPELKATYDYELADSGRSFKRFTAPVRDESGELLGRIFVLREVTAERQGERMKSELVATVSHELRTPLASILGFTELLAERDPDPETRKRYLGTIHGEAKRLTDLINDFLDLQRMEQGGFALSIEPFDLGPLLEEEVELFSAQSTSHRLALDSSEDELRVAGDRDRISQVLANLVSNAIKYSPEGGDVVLSAGRSNGTVRVAVRDSGFGIPAEQQGMIFQKFFRVDSSDTRSIGGTGLGLALCRDIVEAHGGRIGFESVEGKGSTFWFELPAGRRTGAGGRPRVLVVEDDSAMLRLLTDLLGDEGYEAEVARTGEEAIAIVEEDPPLLVCLDIALAGDLDGWDVLARLKAGARTAGVPVVVCTAGNGRGQAATLGAADFVAKPFTAQQLREAVDRLLPGKDGYVLVVDDDELVRALAIESLAEEGLRLREASNGEEALAAVAFERPAAIVLDLMMPTLDGFAVLERLQRNPDTRFIPVVVLTARDLTAEERNALQAAAVTLLEKSAYSAEELRRLIRRAIGRETAQPEPAART